MERGAEELLSGWGAPGCSHRASGLLGFRVKGLGFRVLMGLGFRA